MTPKILVADEDPVLLETLRSTLMTAGFRVTRSGNGASALIKARRGLPSLVICDTQLPQLTGLELCRLLKKGTSTRHIPVIMLSTEATEQDRIAGFELGADDYIAKPCNIQELVLRVRRSLQRAADKFPPKEKITVGELTLDPVRHEVAVQDNAITLTMIEFNLLKLFMENHGTVLDRETLLEEVWGQTLITRALDQHLSRLRFKLGAFGACIETVQGIGYRLHEVPISQFRTRNFRHIKPKTHWHSDRFKQSRVQLVPRKDLAAC